MMHEELTTDFDELNEEYGGDLIYSGAEAFKLMMGEDINDSGRALAYVREGSGLWEELEEGKDLPEGDQDIVLIRDSDTPSSFPIGNTYIADPDVVVRDFRVGNPYLFDDIQSDDFYSEVLEKITSEEIEYDIDLEDNI